MVLRYARAVFRYAMEHGSVLPTDVLLCPARYVLCGRSSAVFGLVRPLTSENNQAGDRSQMERAKRETAHTMLHMLRYQAGDRSQPKMTKRETARTDN